MLAAQNSKAARPVTGSGGFALSPNDAGLGQAFLGVPNWGASC
jgi:hypothetical protein